MRLRRLHHESRPVWATENGLLPDDFSLGRFLAGQADTTPVAPLPETYDVLAPVDHDTEIWASGVTYLRSRVEREAESVAADVYTRVYAAARPELFFKSIGWRTVHPGRSVRIREDSGWDVPEPELVLVVNAGGDIVGYTAGNDVSSRAIEGGNPLYLPQAKTYDGSCAVGSELVITSADNFREASITLTITRNGRTEWDGATSTAEMKRRYEELVAYLFREMSFPRGVLLMTGTGLVPAAPFTLEPGDSVRIQVGEVTLSNTVVRGRA